MGGEEEDGSLRGTRSSQAVSHPSANRAPDTASPLRPHSTGRFHGGVATESDRGRRQGPSRL